MSWRYSVYPGTLPGRMLQRHRPSERRNLKGSLYLHARWRLTSAAAMDDFVGAPKPPQSKKKLSALQRSSQARQRMRSIREGATAPGAIIALTLQIVVLISCIYANIVYTLQTAETTRARKNFSAGAVHYTMYLSVKHFSLHFCCGGICHKLSFRQQEFTLLT